MQRKHHWALQLWTTSNLLKSWRIVPSLLRILQIKDSTAFVFLLQQNHWNQILGFECPSVFAPPTPPGGWIPGTLPTRPSTEESFWMNEWMNELWEAERFKDGKNKPSCPYFSTFYLRRTWSHNKDQGVPRPMRCRVSVLLQVAHVGPTSAAGKRGERRVTEWMNKWMQLSLTQLYIWGKCCNISDHSCELWGPLNLNFGDI